MSMEISDRDKKLLYFVVSIAIVAAAFFFGFRNFADKTNSYKEQTENYNAEYARLIVMQKNRNEYIEKTAQYEEERAKILAIYQDGYTQDDFIINLNSIGEKNKIYIKDIFMNPTEVIYSFTSEAGTVGEVNVSEIEFESDYLSFKDFLVQLLKMNTKTSPTAIELQYKPEDDKPLSGTITFEHYNIRKADSVDPIPSIDLPVGVTNIFDSKGTGVTGTVTGGTNGDYILTNYDACVVVNSSTSGFDSVIVGTTNDSKAKDSISFAENKATELKVIVNGKNGKYTIAYEMAGKKYPEKKFEEGAAFKPGETLDLLILSSERANDKDKVAVKVALENKSDMKLNVLVYGDDKKSPRVTFSERTGDMEIYR